MKKFSFLTSIALLATLSGCGSIFNNPGPELIIVHTNDTHGSVDEEEHGAIGHERIFTILKENKEKYGKENVLFLDAGDTFHGTPFANLKKGDSIAKLLNAMGLDAMVPGNHDFNYGQKTLLALTKGHSLPLITSNVTYAGGKIVGDPYIIRTIQDKKVGIFGLTTPETLTKTNPDNLQGIVFQDPVETAKKIVKDLKYNKVDFIILLSHLGDDPSTKKEWRSSAIAESIPEINLIIDGHSHTPAETSQVINKTVIVRNSANSQSVGIVEVDYDRLKKGPEAIAYKPILKKDAVGVEVLKPVTHMVKQKYYESQPYTVKRGDSLAKLSKIYNVPIDEILTLNPDIVDGRTIILGKTYNMPIEKTREVELTEMLPFRDGEIKKDPLISQAMSLLKDDRNKLLQMRISYTPYQLNGTEDVLNVSESNLGNYIADLAVTKTGADIAIINAGAMKNNLGKGNLSVGSVMSTFPLGGYIPVKQVTGAEIKKMLEEGFSNYPMPSESFPQIGGMLVTVDPSKTPGDRIINITLSNGKKFNLEDKYLLALYRPLNVEDENYEMAGDLEVVAHYPGPAEMVLSTISKLGIPKDYKATDGRIKIAPSQQ